MRHLGLSAVRRALVCVVSLLRDDAKREYAHGRAQGLPATKVGVFTQTLYDEAKKQGWTIVSMKDDWKKIFAFEP